MVRSLRLPKKIKIQNDPLLNSALSSIVVVVSICRWVGALEFEFVFSLRHEKEFHCVESKSQSSLRNINQSLLFDERSIPGKSLFDNRMSLWGNRWRKIKQMMMFFCISIEFFAFDASFFFCRHVSMKSFPPKNFP